MYAPDAKLTIPLGITKSECESKGPPYSLAKLTEEYIGEVIRMVVDSFKSQ